MLESVQERLHDGRFIAMFLGSIGFAATVWSLATPMFQTDQLTKRMKAATTEREKIRQREREIMMAGQQKGGLRVKPKGFVKQFVEALSLKRWLSTETAKAQLLKAGYRGGTAEYAFLTARLVTPLVLLAFAVFYIFVVLKPQWSPILKGAALMGALFVGIKAPEFYLNNKITKRQKYMNRAFPNMLDLMLICVESGMSIELAVKKVASEIGVESIDLAEELTILAAEMSYLQDKRVAFENFASRAGSENMKSFTTVLTQTEKYGTPLGGALRVLSQESRDQRMQMAEKKAAALPPALTVPMILFFLPVLFIAILTPAFIQMSENGAMESTKAGGAKKAAEENR